MQHNLPQTVHAALILTLIAAPAAATGPVVVSENLATKPLAVQPLKKDLVVKPLPKEESNTVDRPAAEIKQIDKPVQAPTPAMKPEIRLSKPPTIDQQKVTVPSTAIKKVTRDNLENAKAVRQADQARGLQDSKGLTDTARAVPGGPTHEGGINRDLGLGRGGNGIPELPGHETQDGFEDPTGRIPGVNGNQDKGGSAGAPIRPSANPADWVSGAASQDANVDKTDGIVTKTWEDTDGNTHVSTDFGTVGNYNYQQTHVYHSGGQTMTVRETWTSRTDGTKHNNVYTTNLDSGAPGMINTREDLPYPAGHARSFVRPRGINRTQDPDSADTDGSWARWQAGIAGNRPDTSVKNPNQVNRGPDGAMSDPQAPRLTPGNELVINPDPDTGNVQGGAPNQRAAEMMRQQMLDKAQGVTPGGHPGGAPSQQQMEGSGESTR